MPRRLRLFAVSLTLLPTLAAIFLPGCGGASASSSGDSKPAVSLLNVSCDPTRELWSDVNEQFAKYYEQKTGREVEVRQSHGGSSSQARAVNDGLDADIVSLAMWQDTDLLRRGGLIAEGWENRSPEKSLPYYSTIIFVVRKGNPKNIHDWNDLARDDIEIVTPHPKTSGNGKLSFLAAWGSVITRGGSEDDAKKLVTKLYQHTPVLDAAARSSTVTFATKNIGDVHLTWENEGKQEVQQSNGELELIYPPVSIRAEPHITWVDKYAQKHGTEAIAKDFVEYLYTPEAQATIAKHFYRPNAKGSREEHAGKFPDIKLFAITDFAKGWDEANQKFFADKALFDQIER
jgi:sulfate/thiosulfate transport system substrate-binding protein